jgi:hypothetical protein
MSEKKTFEEMIAEFVKYKLELCPGRFGLDEDVSCGESGGLECHECWEHAKKKWEEENR